MSRGQDGVTDITGQRSGPSRRFWGVLLWMRWETIGGWEHNNISSVQSLSHAWLFVTPWTAARQASLSISNSQSLLKLMSIESVMPPNHLTLCYPLLLLPSIFPRIRSFTRSQLFERGGQSTGASASVLPKNIQDRFPLGLTGFISLLFKGVSRPTSQFKSTHSSALSFLYGPTVILIHDY